MKRYISFCLFGGSPKYCLGAVQNAHLIPEIYPGWQPIFYIGQDVPPNVVDDLSDLGAEICYVESLNMPGTALRFLVNDLPCERYICRDADSRLNHREKAAVNAWIDSDRACHTMRDHPAHARPINGGMWGCKHGVIHDMAKMLDGFHPTRFTADQELLNETIWPLVKNDCLQHDSFSRSAFPGSLPFPTPRVDDEFVGEVINADGSRRNFDVAAIHAALDRQSQI